MSVRRCLTAVVVLAAVSTGAASAALVASAPPSVAFLGTPRVGMKLPGEPGTWARRGAVSPAVFVAHELRWLRCDARGNSCVAIRGAIASTYVVRAADAGYRLRFEDLVSSSAGSATAISDATPVVQA